MLTFNYATLILEINNAVHNGIRLYPRPGDVYTVRVGDRLLAQEADALHTVAGPARVRVVSPGRAQVEPA